MTNYIDEKMREFEKEFTYIDKEGNPRINNKSPRKIKGFIKSVLTEQRERLILDEKELIEFVRRFNLLDEEKYKDLWEAKKGLAKAICSLQEEGDMDELCQSDVLKLRGDDEEA